MGKTDVPWHLLGVPTRLLRKQQLVTAGPDRLPVYTLTFQLPNDVASNEHTRPHRDIRLDLGDVVKMVIPNYKPKSYSVSALRDDEFDVTFKVYPNGRASGYLDRLVVGEDVLRSFVKKQSARERNPSGTHVGIIAYGVGITEGLPVAAAELQRTGEVQQVILLWAARTRQDLFWHEAIAALQQQHPQRFRMVHIFSREPVSTTSGDTTNDVLCGRIDESVLRTVFQSSFPSIETARFLSVGTKDMMRMTDDLLTQAGFPMPQCALLPKKIKEAKDRE
jgi:NAD(P)H-flavin reductase